MLSLTSAMRERFTQITVLAVGASNTDDHIKKMIVPQLTMVCGLAGVIFFVFLLVITSPGSLQI